MLIDVILIFLVLLISIFIGSVIFWILLNKKFKFWQTIKLYCVASALNKLLLTPALGYATMSWKLKSDGFPLHRSLASFAVFELFSVLPWLISGFYFGAKITLKVPVFLIVILVLILLSVIFKREAIIHFLKNVLNYLKELKFGFLGIIPLVITNVALGTIYYFFLFKVFGFSLKLLDILKVSSVSFTLGYLSILPSGLGVKEGSMIYLLAKQGISLSSSTSIAITDRLLVTSLYASLGFLFGANIIKDEIKRRFFRIRNHSRAIGKN